LKYTVTAGWSHAPHLTPEAIAEMSASYPPHELEARKNGTPTLGAGKIYEIPEETFVMDPFPIPDHWYQSYGLDVGWNRTAAIWVAEDRDADVAYFHSEHYAAEELPAIHAAAIKGRGAWIPGVIDPAARGRSQIDGEKLIELYQAAGLDLEAADNSVEAGIYEIRQRLLGGRLKVFRNCANWLAEYKLYRRDEKGKVVKKKDHAQDAGRYAIMSGLERGKQAAPRRHSLLGRGGRVFTG
jgi:hypothetical protein